MPRLPRGPLLLLLLPLLLLLHGPSPATAALLPNADDIGVALPVPAGRRPQRLPRASLVSVHIQQRLCRRKGALGGRRAPAPAGARPSAGPGRRGSAAGGRAGQGQDEAAVDEPRWRRLPALPAPPAGRYKGWVERS